MHNAKPDVETIRKLAVQWVAGLSSRHARSHQWRTSQSSDDWDTLILLGIWINLVKERHTAAKARPGVAADETPKLRLTLGPVVKGRRGARVDPPAAVPLSA
jgi:hypothetical protein